ncbi:MAG: hypothetical protein Q8941_02165 [Bacteroidota bacterium]|nr:hypothetical protein [Bacteroidota bacterium]
MKTLLFLLVSFIALTATFSGLLMIGRPDGSSLNLPVSYLEPTPFKDFLVPGILLAVVVGGTNFLAVFSNMGRRANRYNWSLAGGIIITVWIIIQLLLLGAANWLHFIYLATGVAIILVSLQLKGKWLA